MENTSTVALVVNYCTHEHVEALLKDLQKEPLTAIVLVDNFSCADELAKIEELVDREDNVHLVRCPENIGFGAAMNVAARTAIQYYSPNFLWMLNPDITIADRCLSQLIATSRRTKAIVSPVILSPGSRTIWFAGGSIIKEAGRATHFGINTPYRGLNTDLEVSFITGAAPLVPIEHWEQLQGFREDFFLYCEDADMSIRAVSLGIPLFVSCEAEVFHLEGASSGTGGPSANFYYYVQRNRLNLYSKYGSKLNLLLGKGIVETARLTLLPFRPLDRASLSRFILSIRGLLDGLRGKTGRRE